MAAKFELKISKSGKISFSLKSANGKVVLTSEAYGDRKAAVKGVESVKKNAGNDKRYEKLTTKSGAQYFVMKGSNGEVIGKSHMYKDTRGVRRGIASVMKSAPGARLDDTTKAK